MFVTAALVAGVAAYRDLRTGLIPNGLTLTAIAIGVVEHGVVAASRGGPTAIPGAVALSLAGALLAALLPLVLWRLGALGGGDVKLFMALGAILGPTHGLEAELLAFVCGGLFTPVRLAWQGRLLETLRRTGVVFVNLFLPASRKRPLNEAALTWMRFGPAIFAGTLWEIFARGAGT